MSSFLDGVRKAIGLGFLALLLTACGGGSDDGGFTNAETTIQVTIQADSTTIPANLTGEAPSLILPFTTSVIVRAVREDGSPVPNGTTVQLALNGVNQGAITILDDPETEDINEFFVLTGTNFTETASGQAQFFFTSASNPGVATLTASVQDPVNGKTIVATLQITVEGVNRPVASLSFAGPFVDAVLEGRSRFGSPLQQNGAYSRVVSVVATDPSGNPVPPGTQINFYLVDGPITGYPNGGAGSFFVSGNNGDPIEGNFLFSAAGGNFQSNGVRSFDRLVLDGTQTILPDNRDLTGVRVVETVISQSQLYIQRQGSPFPQTIDNGATVPYVIGRAQHATILSPSFTDGTGTADTLLTYPVFRIGQTAILVACNADNSVCTVLNTCNAGGSNCGSVYLGVSDGVDRILTVSAETLGPNTSTPVQLCLQDANLAPLPAAPITYSVGPKGSAAVTVNGNASSTGTLMTGGSGCVSTTITSSGQIAGSDPIDITFDADGLLFPVDLTINSPGAGFLMGTISNPSVELQLIDENGTPIPDTFISHTVEVEDVDNSCDTSGSEASNVLPGAAVTYDPDTQLTDMDGRLTAMVEILGDSGDIVTITFTAMGGAEFSVTYSNLDDVPVCPEEPPAP